MSNSHLQTAKLFMPLCSVLMGYNGPATSKHALTTSVPDMLMQLYKRHQSFQSFPEANLNSNQNPNQGLLQAYDKNHNSQKAGSFNQNQTWMIIHNLQNPSFPNLLYSSDDINKVVLCHKVTFTLRASDKANQIVNQTNSSTVNFKYFFLNGASQINLSSK